MEHDTQAPDAPRRAVSRGSGAGRRDLRLVARPGVRIGVVVACLVAFLSAWAFASPVGSSPDEPYHLASIWCAQGEREGACEPAEEPAVYAVPAALLEASCFAFRSEISAACQTRSFIAAEEEFLPTDVGNFGAHAGDYPPGFYATMSVFVGPDIEHSVMVMRFVNIAILATMLTATYLVSSVRARRSLVAAVGVTIIPLGAFVIPSVNPSSWAITSAMTLFFGVFGWLTATGRARRVTLGVVSVLALALGAGARADASIYAILAIGAAVLIALPWAKPTRDTVVRVSLPIVLAIFAATSYLTAGQAGAAGQTAAPGVSRIIGVFWDIFAYWQGALGSSGLGWLDTQLPSIVWLPMTAAFFGVILVGIAHVGWRRGLAVLGVAFGAALLPTYVMATSLAPEGSVQARYIYPLLIVLVAVATLGVERREFVLTAVQRWVVVAAVSCAGAVALFTNLQRYVVGTGQNGSRLSPAQWWWEWMPLSAEVVLVIGSLAFLGALAVASAVWVGPRERQNADIVPAA